MLRQRALAPALVAALALTLVACGDDDSGSDTTPVTDASAVPATEASGTVSEIVAGEPMPADRCAANQEAGTITYLSGFDFAAAASIVDVLVALDKGYYDELCLDVEVKPSFSTANYPLIAANEAQFASGGSFSEVVQFAQQNDADFVAVAVEGQTTIDSLIVKEGEATTLEDLAGTTIGVKGKLPPSVAAMLAGAGLVEGEDFQTVLLDGFDPTAHIAIDQIVGFPGYKSNEPGQLERAGIPFTLFDPSDYDVPGSFGVIVSNADFVAEHPTAAEDFVRATMRGLADAVADPEAAANIAVEHINGNGNPNFLSPEGEVFRWTTDAGLVVANTPEGLPLGVTTLEARQGELDAYAAVGLFEGPAPDAAPYLDIDLIAGVYDDTGAVIWPG